MYAALRRVVIERLDLRASRVQEGAKKGPRKGVGWGDLVNMPEASIIDGGYILHEFEAWSEDCVLTC